MRSLRLTFAPLALSAALVCSCSKDDAKDKAAKEDSTEDTVEATGRRDFPRPDLDALPETAPPTRDSPPIRERGEVVATLQLPQGVGLGDIALAADNIKLGTSGVLRLQAPGVISKMAKTELDGANLAGPISFVLANPTAGGEKAAAMLVEVEDAATLREAVAGAGRELRERDGMALIGSAEAVTAVEDYAFTHLSKAPDHTELVIYPAPLLETFGPQMQQFAAMANSQATGLEGVSALFQSYVDWLTGLGEQTDRIVVSVSSGKQSTDAFVRMYPVAGSDFAAFVAAQEPAQHALLARLPAGDPAGLMSGLLRAGDAANPLLELAATAMTALYHSEIDAARWAELMGAWVDTTDGRFAGLIDIDSGSGIPNPSVIGLYGAEDPEAMLRSWRAMMEALAGSEGLAMMGMTMGVTYEIGAGEHDGVSIDRYGTKLDLSSASPEVRAALDKTGSQLDQQMDFAVLDGLGAMAKVEDESMAKLIDAVRGKGETFTPSGDLQQALESSKALGESLMYWIDFSRLLPAEAKDEVPFGAVVVGVGKQGEALSLHMSLRK